MEIQKVKELALANGFKLKEQASGNMDLNSYVYDFANAIEQAAKAQFIEDLEILDLNSNEVHKVRSFHNDQTGEDDLSSYYSYYQEIALKDQGCTPIIDLSG